MWNLVSILLLCSNIAYWLRFILFIFHLSKATCLILQFSSVPRDLCKPQLWRLLRMKCNEMAQRWYGCESMRASGCTSCQDSHRAVPIPKGASGGSHGLPLKIDSQLSTLTYEVRAAHRCMRILFLWMATWGMAGRENVFSHHSHERKIKHTGHLAFFKGRVLEGAPETTFSYHLQPGPGTGRHFS